MSDAYLKLSRYLPANVCLKYSTEAWEEISASREEAERAERAREAKLTQERMCEHMHAALMLPADLWNEEVEKSTHVFAIPNAYVWMTPSRAGRFL